MGPAKHGDIATANPALPKMPDLVLYDRKGQKTALQDSELPMLEYSEPHDFSLQNSELPMLQPPP